MGYNYLLYIMQHDKPRELLCSDELFNYYGIGIAGYWLLFRKGRLKDGRRCFYLTDRLAMCLGFENLQQMRYCLTGLQYWRRFVSVERLQVALDRYHNIEI